MTIKAGLAAQRKVAELLSDGNWYSVASIAKSTGLGAEAIDVLYRMEQIGAVECEIIGGHSRYRDAAQAGSLKPQPRHPQRNHAHPRRGAAGSSVYPALYAYGGSMTICLDINYFRRRIAEKEQELAAAEEIGDTSATEEASRDLESCRRFLARFETQERKQ